MSNNCNFLEGMTDTSKDMTKTTWVFPSELPTWSLRTCRTLTAGSANNRVVCHRQQSGVTDTQSWVTSTQSLVSGTQRYKLQGSPSCWLDRFTASNITWEERLIPGQNFNLSLPWFCSLSPSPSPRRTGPGRTSAYTSPENMVSGRKQGLNSHI